MITEDYVSFEVAKLLKEKGFEEETWGYYPIKGDGIGLFRRSGVEYNHNNSQVQISAPTLQMVQKWLREEHKVDIAIYHELNDDSTSVYYKYIGVMPGKTVFECKQGAVKYEQAVENAIKWVLENLIEND